MSPLYLPEPVIQIVGKRQAVLREDYEVRYKNKSFIIPSGFQFDGASMPSFTWSILRLSPFGRISAAALPHDLMYVNCGRIRGIDGHWLHFTEREADEIFYNRCKNADLNWLQSRLVRRAVIWFGNYDVEGKSNSATWNKEWLGEYNYGYTGLSGPAL